MKRCWGVILLALISGCASKPPAPVVERAPESAQQPSRPQPSATEKPAATQTQASKPAPPAADWRPETVIVKKGDTLHAIGLEYGLDYQDIAAWNNIPPPYLIRVGQKLRLREPKGGKPVTAASKPAEPEVIVTPLKTDAAASAKPLTDSPPPPAAKVSEAATAQPQATATEPPLLSEPKATKGRYSDKAMAATKPVDKTAEGSRTDKAADKTESAAEKNAPADADAVDWAWPVSGKILAGFNDAASAKGVDIAGSQGQAVHAAAGGKVVYSGSSLRGYGKLVIIKHNAIYLSAYAHNSQLLVKEGQEVTKGQKIAEMGSTDTDRVKLHFEIRKLGKPVDPTQYLPASAGPAQ